MKRIKEVIVVEGRFDKNTVSQVVDAIIIETTGFQVFSDNEKLSLLRTLADKRGIIILTDSDSAGFFIRGRLRGLLDNKNVKHAYIPDIYGREKRKQTSSREGKVGVEGMRRDIIMESLERAGATFIDNETTDRDESSDLSDDDLFSSMLISTVDLYETGLTGKANSSARRKDLLISLGLPERLSTSGMLDVLNALYTKEEFYVTISRKE